MSSVREAATPNHGMSGTTDGCSSSGTTSCGSSGRSSVTEASARRGATSTSSSPTPFSRSADREARCGPVC